MEETWRSESEEGVDAERPARSGEDEEKPLLGRVAAGDILSHTQEDMKLCSFSRRLLQSIPLPLTS